MKKKFIIALMTGSLLIFNSCGDSEQDDSVDMAEDQNEQMHDNTGMEKDAEFAVKAASGGMMEVELGNIAAQKGVSQEVRQFGQQMVTDHSAANDELKTLAMAKNISLPATMGEDKQDKVSKLSGKEGADFDKEYIDHMIKDHKEDIDLFEKQSNNGNDMDLKNWAAEKLPTLRHHLEMAENIQKTLK